MSIAGMMLGNRHIKYHFRTILASSVAVLSRFKYQLHHISTPWIDQRLYLNSHSVGLYRVNKLDKLVEDGGKQRCCMLTFVYFETAKKPSSANCWQNFFCLVCFKTWCTIFLKSIGLIFIVNESILFDTFKFNLTMCKFV